MSLTSIDLSNNWCALSPVNWINNYLSHVWLAQHRVRTGSERQVRIINGRVLSFLYDKFKDAVPYLTGLVSLLLFIIISHPPLRRR